MMCYFSCVLFLEVSSDCWLCGLDVLGDVLYVEVNTSKSQCGIGVVIAVAKGL